MTNNIQLNKTFRLFSSCIPVKGIVRSIVYDLNRENFEYIPNGLFKILSDFNGRTIQNVISSHNVKENNTIIEYFEFLIEKEFIFFSELPSDMFPELNQEFKSSYRISNMVIDLSEEVCKFLPKLLKQIDILGCEAISLRFLTLDVHTKYFDEVLDAFSKSSCRSIEISTIFNNDLAKAELIKYFDKVCLEMQRIFRVHLFEAPFDEFNKLPDSVGLLYFHKVSLNPSASHVVNLRNFAVNIQMYVESLNFNTYYNRKIYINQKGDIRNSPSSLIDYGNFEHTTVEDVLGRDDFLKLGAIKKDDIMVCKDCEYRYMCVDARTPEKKNEFFAFAKACSYDPYSGKWKNSN